MRTFITVAGLMTGVALLAANVVRGEESVPYDKLPLAPASARVDLKNPVFSNPLAITNPLFPIAGMQQVIQLGEDEEGKPKRVEFTLLPETKTIEWRGQKIETRVVQFLAFLDGEIDEVALDFHAQADDGAVWYFGEDVFNYGDGIIADHEGTWLTGRDGAPAMIMPANPKVGDVYRPEDVRNVVFEEVIVEKVNFTYEAGPRGPVTGLLQIKELHMDGKFELKSFAPGYGEFLTPGENIAVAVPTDVLTTPEPVEIDAMLSGASALAGTAAQDGEKTLKGIIKAWAALKANHQPPLLVKQMNDALDELAKSIKSGDADEIRQTAITTVLAVLDFKLQYRPVSEVDRARLAIWANKADADATANDASAFTGDVAVLEWIWKRTAHIAGAEAQKSVGIPLADLRRAAADTNMTNAIDAARKLQEAFAAL
jgi:hypothetical protein